MLLTEPKRENSSVHVQVNGDGMNERQYATNDEFKEEERQKSLPCIQNKNREGFNLMETMNLIYFMLF